MKPASCCFFFLFFFKYHLLPLTLAHTFLSRSSRKRMSVIMRTPSGKIRLYCKGAVSVCPSPWQHVTAHRCHSQKTRVLKGPCVKPWLLSGCGCSERRFKSSLSPPCFLLYFVGSVTIVLVSVQDTVIYDRLADSSRYKEITLKHLEQFATEGECANSALWRQGPQNMYFDFFRILTTRFVLVEALSFLFSVFITGQWLDSRSQHWNIIYLSLWV